MSLWMARGGRYGEHENLSFENELACIGFHKMPDPMLENGRNLDYQSLLLPILILCSRSSICAFISDRIFSSSAYFRPTRLRR